MCRSQKFRFCFVNHRMNLKEIGVNTRNWVDSTQDRDYWRALLNAALIPGLHKPWS